MKKIPYTERQYYNAINNDSNSSLFLNTTKPSLYLDMTIDDTINRGPYSARSITSKLNLNRYSNRSNDRMVDQVNPSFFTHGVSLETIKQLSDQVEKLVEELKIQIEINKDILQENEIISQKYYRLKQKVLLHIQNEEVDSERFMNNYNQTLEKLMKTQKKLKEDLMSADKNKVSNKSDERTLEQKFMKIKQENLNLRKQLGIEESNQNFAWSPKKRGQSNKKIKNNFKNMNSNKLLAELMNKENLENIEKEISSYRYDKLNEILNSSSSQIVKDQQNPSQNQQQKDPQLPSQNIQKEKSSERIRQNQHQITTKASPFKNHDLQKQKDLSSNLKSHIQKSLYSFGHKSPFTSSQTSEDKVDDIVNYNPKTHYYTTQNIPFSHKTSDKVENSKQNKYEVSSNIQEQYKV